MSTVDERTLQASASLTTDVSWLDVNSLFRLNGRPCLLPGVHAINNSLMNLFRCPIGARGRIFQPTYGTFLYTLLHEPLDQITANKIRASLIQSIERWEPRIAIDYANTSVTPNVNIAGFVVQIVYFYRLTNERQAVTFIAQQ